MPKAAVHKHCELRGREQDVDTNSPPLIDLEAVILSEPRSGAMKSRTQSDLGLRVGLPVPLHDGRHARVRWIGITV
jgi:hypothetical protein